jgi:SPOR domain
MPEPTGRRVPFDWEAGGRAIGPSLDAFHAIVVLGLDPVATSRVALGLARVQAETRRVAVGDLFAESPPIQELVQGDDPHGIVDSFLYGVSVSRIAHRVQGTENLYVMPSGTEAPDYDEILPSPRWKRLASGFREEGALLVLAAPSSAPHIADLVSATDGAILVGERVPAEVSATEVIAAVREPSRAAFVVAPPPENVPTWRSPAAWARARPRAAGGAGVLLVASLAGMVWWLSSRPFADGPLMQPRATADSAHSASQAGVADSLLRPDSARADSAAMALLPVDQIPRVLHPQDSTIAAVYAVELMAANTQAGAILKLQESSKEMPAATFSPVIVDGAVWYKVIAGAYTTRGQADALLATLRRRKAVDPRSGSVVRAPFAFLIDSGVPTAAVPGMLATYAYRGQPVYALRQPNGSAWLFVGAFESAEQSIKYAESLRASEITPVLVYRKGRVF